MKILMVNKFLYPRGGAETYMLRIGEELTRRGHQVEYFGMYDEKNTVGNAEGLTTVNMDFHASGAEKLLYPFRIIYSGEARRKMRQVIDRFHPDIIHFNNINFQLTPSVILAGAEKNIPMVQTVHDLQKLCPNHMMMEFGTWKLCEECSGKKCKMACVRKKCIHGSRAKSLIGAIEGTIYTSSHVYDRVARYICPSRFMEKKLLSVPRYAGKTTMIHNFLSKTAEINAPKGDYVLYFGRLSEEKGIDRILAACRLLPEIPFVIAGGGAAGGAVPNVRLAQRALRRLQDWKRTAGACRGGALHPPPLPVVRKLSAGAAGIAVAGHAGAVQPHRRNAGAGGGGQNGCPQRHLHARSLCGEDSRAV